MIRSTGTRIAGWRANRSFASYLQSWANFELPSEFWAIAVATFFFNLGVSIFLLLYNLLMLDVGFRERALGMFASSMAIGAVAGAIPVGMFAVRSGCKKVLSACLILVAAAFAARVFLIWTTAQIALSLLSGVALCGWTVCLAPSVARVVEERRRPLAFSLLFATAVLAGSLGGFIGGHMPDWCRWMAMHLGKAISPLQGKKFTLLGACAAIALGALPVMRFTSDPSPPVRLRYSKPSPFLARFLLATACWGAAMGAFNPFVNVFFSRYLNLAIPRLGSLFSLAQLAGAAAVLLMPMMIRRTGLLPGILILQLTAAACLGWISAGHGPKNMELAYCGLMAAQLMCAPAIQTLLMNRVAPDERSNAAATSFLALSIAQAVAAAAAGVAFTRFPYVHVIAGISLAAVAAAISFWWLCGSQAELESSVAVAVQRKAAPQT